MTGQGMRAREALERANPLAYIYPGGISYLDSDDPDDAARPLMDRLTGGYWYATGYRVQGSNKPPADAPEGIPAERWEYLTIDFGRNTARGGGLEYHGLRFFDCEAPATRAGRPAQDRPLKERAEEWAREQLRQPRRTYREVAQEIAAREGLDVEAVEREARRARNLKPAGK